MKVNFNFNTRLGDFGVSVDALYERNGDIHGCGGSASCEIIQVVDEYGLSIVVSEAEQDILIEKGIQAGTDLI